MRLLIFREDRTFNKHQINQTFINISFLYPYMHFIAQGIDFLSALAYNAIALLIELVVVIIQISQSHHTLTLGFYDLNIDSPFRYTADKAFVFLVLGVRHEFYLLVFDRSTLSICSSFFAFRGMNTFCFILCT